MRLNFTVLGPSVSPRKSLPASFLPAGFLCVVALLGSAWIVLSSGFYPIDECAHFLYSRFVLSALPVTVQTWHRPGRLWLFALPAQLGHTFTMFFCLALFLCLLLLTYRIALLMKIRHAEWAILLTGLQPVLFDISYACLAEMPAALVLAFSLWCHLKGRHGWSLAFSSLVFLFRFEMYTVALLMFFLYLRKREWRILPLLVLGPLLWIGSSAVISGDVTTFFREWDNFSHLGKYVAGVPLTYYLVHLQSVFGIAQVVLLAAGVLFIVTGGKIAAYGIPLFTIAVNVAVNTLAGAETFHWTGSIGELRYIALIGPFVGIIATYGLSEMLDSPGLRQGRSLIALFVFAIAVLNCTMTTQPRRWTAYDQIVIGMAGDARSRYPDLPLLSNNYVAAYALDVAPSGGSHFDRLDATTLARYERCVLLWDSMSSNPRFFQTGLTGESLLRDSTVTVLERDRYWNTEYLLLLRQEHTGRRTN
jgi:hypothetical protein